MSTVLDVYNSFNKYIKNIQKRHDGTKVFISAESQYFRNNLDRLSNTIFSMSFDIPFRSVAFITHTHRVHIRAEKGHEDGCFVGFIIVELLNYSCIGTIKVHHNKPNKDGLINAGYLYDTIGKDAGVDTQVKNRPLVGKYNRGEGRNIGEWCSFRNGKYMVVAVDFDIYDRDSDATVVRKNLSIDNTKLKDDYGNDVHLKDFIWQQILDTITYFYELVGEDFEVKIIDQPKVKDKKGGKKRKPQGPPLFTIVRRPRTTVTVDVTQVTQECPKSNEPVVHRGPLEYGHYRRPHTRTFRHPRYVNVLGKTIEVRGTRVGPEKERETVYLVAKSKGDAI